MNWEIGIDMYTLMCIELMTNKNLLYKKINKIKFKKTPHCSFKVVLNIFVTQSLDKSWGFLLKSSKLSCDP